MSEVNFKPAPNYYLVESAEPEKTDGGIHIPEVAMMNQKFLRGRVVAEGIEPRNAQGERTPLTYKVGQVVFYNQSAAGQALNITLDGQRYEMVHETRILGYEPEQE